MRRDRDSDLNGHSLTNISSITLNTQAVNDNEVITKAYVDQFHQENERQRRSLGIDFYDENEDLVKNNQSNNLNNNEITNVKNIKTNDEAVNEKDATNKIYFDSVVDESSIVRYNSSFDIYLQVRVGNTAYKLQIYTKTQIIDTIVIKHSNTGGYLLQKWKIECNDKNNSGKIQNFIQSSISNSPTGDSGAESIPPIGDSFMYVETSGNNNGEGVFCSWERTDLIHISNITFYYNRFSTSNASLRRMGRFRIQILKKCYMANNIYY